MLDVRFLRCATAIIATTRDQLEAYEWIANHAKSQNKRVVVNASWGRNMTNGDPNTAPGAAAIAALVESGVVFVVNSGNAGLREGNTCTRFPAGLDTTVAVGATNATDYVTGFSNYGECVDILAPGHKLFFNNVIYCFDIIFEAGAEVDWF